MRSAPRKLSKTAKPRCSSARSAECAEKRACVGAQSVRSDGAAAASSALWTPVAALNVCLGAVPYSVRSRVEGAAAPGALDAMPGRPMRCWWHSGRQGDEEAGPIHTEAQGDSAHEQCDRSRSAAAPGAASTIRPGFLARARAQHVATRWSLHGDPNRTSLSSIDRTFI